MAIFKRLLGNLQLDPALAERTATAVASAQTVPPGTPRSRRRRAAEAGAVRVDADRLTQLDDLLSIPGYTAEIVAKLRDFVIVLPEATRSM